VFVLAVAAADLGVGGHEGHQEGRALLELALGVVVGVAVGLCSAGLITYGSRRGWIVTGGRRLATLAAALASFALAVALDGNGFIAAFVAGIAFGASLPADVADVEDVGELPELMGELLALAVWFLFGAALVPIAFAHFSVWTLVYAVLSLTLIRLLPVALALLGMQMDRPTVLFVGWFGPRGLASVVFALLAVEELGESALVGQAVGLVALTVLLSVVLHGLSAGPLGGRYVREEADAESMEAPRSRRAGHVV
jgi:NhaP-type Na+/H+ or K+/H+ antiporter